MISDAALLSAVHVLLDRLMDSGDRDGYYRINHASAADIKRLVRVIGVWLALVKVDVSEEVVTHGLQEEWRQGQEEVK